MAARFPDSVPTLTDGVVTLRPHTAADAAALEEQAADPEMVRWTTVPVPSSRESAVAFATRVIPEGWESGREWAFAVEAPDDEGTSRFVGTVSLRDEGERRAEVAYGAAAWARGRGYVARALRLLLEWGFTEKRLETVIWWAFVGNWASRRVAWRVGFSCDGAVRRWLPQRGELHDAWVGALTRKDPQLPRHEWLDAPPIGSRGVRLRPLRDDDVGRVVEACTDPVTTAWLTQLPSPYTSDHARQWLEETREAAARARAVTWATADPADDRLLGVVTVFDIAEEQAEVGYWSHPEARGRGLTTTACGLAVRHAFVPAEDGGLGLRRLRAYVAEGNAASAAVLEANGFVATGRLRQQKRMRDGSFVDLLHYDLLAGELVHPPDRPVNGASSAQPVPR